MTVPSRWLRETRRTYFGNAAAQRDFRVQLRGNRSMMLFGLYLAILIGVAWFAYSDIQTRAAFSVVETQRQLRNFYTTIVTMLAGMVSIVTPGLAATAIVLERQRRSLDLVFSAPVPPRYYLVGKIIAVYRYIWMLLILSLPVTAACVVLGGASWSDVLTVYGLLSIHGLLFAAIGLMMSTIAPKPIAAVVWTYVAVAGYQMVMGSVATASYGMRMFRGASSEAPFTVGLSPFSAIFAVGTHTTILGIEVPNWTLVGLAVLVVVRLCLLGAGSLLSDGRETANLRINWAILVAAVAYGLGSWLVNSGAYSSMSSVARSGAPFASSDPAAVYLGYGLFWVLSPLVLAVPNLAAYGRDGAGRQRPNGAFSLRHALDGTPAGGLPYIVALTALVIVFGLAGFHFAGGKLPGPTFLVYVLFTLGFWSLFWAITRAASSTGAGLRASRTAMVAGFVLLVVLPVPFMSAMFAGTFSETGFSIWDLYVLRPVLQFSEVKPVQALAYGSLLAAASLGLHVWSQARWRRTEAARG